MSIEELSRLYAEWGAWAQTAPHPRYSFEAWQAGFPDWDRMLKSAAELMLTGTTETDAVRLISACWAVDQAEEQLAMTALEHIDVCFDVVVAIAGSRFPAARRQALDILGDVGAKAEAHLRHGVHDPDAACRIQALSGLKHLRPDDAEALARPMFSDADTQVRYAAYQLAVCNIPSHIRYFTRAWYGGETETDAFLEYERSVSMLASQQTDSIVQLARTNIHDAHVVALELSPADAAITVRARSADADLDTTIWYRGAMLAETDVDPVADKLLAAETELLYHEVEQCEDGRYEHRILLWPREEFVVRFAEVSVATS